MLKDSESWGGRGPKVLDPNFKSLCPESVSHSTGTPKVCRIIAFYRFWAIILPTFRGLGIQFFAEESESRP